MLSMNSKGIDFIRIDNHNLGKLTIILIPKIHVFIIPLEWTVYQNRYRIIRTAELPLKKINTNVKMTKK